MVFTVLHLSIFSGILIESNHGVTKSVEGIFEKESKAKLCADTLHCRSNMP